MNQRRNQSERAKDFSALQAASRMAREAAARAYWQAKADDASDEQARAAAKEARAEAVQKAAEKYAQASAVEKEVQS